MKKEIKRIYRYFKIIQNIDIVEELEDRGIKGKVLGENFFICCPIHGEKNPSMGIVVKGNKKGIFNCFSCGQTGTFFDLIAFLDDISLDQAFQKYIKNDIDVKELSELKKYFLNMLEKKEVNTEDQIKYYNKKFLNKFDKPYNEFLDYLIKQRKLNQNTIDKFNILCCNGKGSGYAKFWKDRIIIPIIDINEKLAGVTARYIYDCDKSFKVRKIKDSDISKVLFGLKYIKKGSPLIACEGEIDVMYLQQYNIPAIKTGKFLSKLMINQIMQHTDKLIYAPDGDVPFINPDPKKYKDSIKYQKEYLSQFFQLEIIRLPENKDPNNLNEAEIKKYFGKYINKKYFK